MLAELVLNAVLSTAKIDADLRHEMTVAMAAYVESDRRRHQRQQAALWGSSLFLIEGIADCIQTSTRISHYGTTENNPFTPTIIKTEFHRDHPGLCIGGFGITAGLWYAATHRMDPSVQVPGPVLEGVNLFSQH